MNKKKPASKTPRYLTGDRVRRTALALVQVYGNRCAKCLQPIDVELRHPDPNSLSIGHQLPLARGGTDEISNLRPEHLRCNLRASDQVASYRAPAVTPDFFR